VCGGRACACASARACAQAAPPLAPSFLLADEAAEADEKPARERQDGGGGGLESEPPVPRLLSRRPPRRPVLHRQTRRSSRRPLRPSRPRSTSRLEQVSAGCRAAAADVVVVRRPNEEVPTPNARAPPDAVSVLRVARQEGERKGLKVPRATSSSLPSHHIVFHIHSQAFPSCSRRSPSAFPPKIRLPLSNQVASVARRRWPCWRRSCGGTTPRGKT